MLNFGKKNDFKKIKKCDIIYSNRIREELKKKPTVKTEQKILRKLFKSL